MSPLLRGTRVLLYPSPLHYRTIPEMAYDHDCTVLFTTGTLLAHYGRHANPYDFRSIRVMVGGAEKISHEVQRLYSEKFGIRILEGYGATECAPVLSANTPMAYRAGTVGELFPGIEYRIAPAAGIEGGGMLHVKGPNVMLGYLRPDGTIAPVRSEFGEGWYETGDIVSMDDRFVTLLGRMRRFAKVAGEMVSLELAEKIAVAASPQFHHASAAAAQAGRGEAIVLFTEDPALRREQLLEAARATGAPELAVPRRIVHIPKLPLLGNGKRNYPALDRMAREGVATPATPARSM
jgi:acyl-[acyl-carrier-protein]-phospholipid O-acyltransferase/long-chain-fatty-acid--[acyl-carrier-protein] ligase